MSYIFGVEGQPRITPRLWYTGLAVPPAPVRWSPWTARTDPPDRDVLDTVRFWIRSIVKKWVEGSRCKRATKLPTHAINGKCSSWSATYKQPHIALVFSIITHF